ncbi:MAG TPA: YihY/virulence factor BrkB family protein [Pseudonocardiaceae bacterium]|nr:YihY/virulence factor BrkB family protein [Pseudonocardiaceae bacterium]
MNAPAKRATDQPARRGLLHLIARTAVKAWDDSFVSMSAQAAFWMTLSLPPLLLGLLGSLGFVASWFGPATVEAAQREIVRFSTTVFSADVVNQIIRPTVSDILTQGHSTIVSVGFVLSLWAGSSALASLVDSITAAYQQHTVRNPVWQRIFALLLYVVALIGSVLVLPLTALGPNLISELLPDSVRPTMAQLVGIFYYPGLGILLMIGLATLYNVVLPNKLPWHRGLPGAVLAMVVFLVTSTGLRLYIASVAVTGYTYGALATPIAYLLFSFFIAMAIVLGAELNSAIEELWPAHPTRRDRRRERRREMARLAARDRAASDGAQWQRGRAPGPPPGQDSHTTATVETSSPGAPSPADTTHTLELPRNGAGPSDASTPAPLQRPPGADRGSPPRSAAE